MNIKEKILMYIKTPAGIKTRDNNRDYYNHGYVKGEKNERL